MAAWSKDVKAEMASRGMMISYPRKRAEPAVCKTQMLATVPEIIKYFIPFWRRRRSRSGGKKSIVSSFANKVIAAQGFEFRNNLGAGGSFDGMGGPDKKLGVIGPVPILGKDYGYFDFLALDTRLRILGIVGRDS